MKENMTVSGTHDNDEPWNFVECAMVKVPGFTKIAVYYFYKRCEACDDEIDTVFQPFLDQAMVGNTTSLGGDNDSDYGQEEEDGGSFASTSTTTAKRQRVNLEKDALNKM